MSEQTPPPAWAIRIRDARRAKVGTVSDMAAALKTAAGDRGRLPSLAHLSRTIRGWERGAHYPSERYRLLYARALNVPDGELFDKAEEPVVPVPALTLPAILPDMDLYQRVTESVLEPSRADQRTIDWLATCLAEHRKVEDTLGARPLLDIVRQQLGIVMRLAAGARSPFATQVIDLAAQYAQFVAWMSLDIGDQAGALAWYARAHDWALEIGDANMAVTTLSMKAHQAWSLGNARRCVGLAESALWHDGQTTPGVQGMAVQMAARGHAIGGDRPSAHTLIDEAEALIARASDYAEREPVWMYFYDETWFLLQRGMIELHLADWSKAIDLLSQGLNSLPTTFTRDRAWYGSCLARAYAEAGDSLAAVEIGVPLVPDAVELNRHARAQLSDVAAFLKARKSVHARTLADALATSKM